MLVIVALKVFYGLIRLKRFVSRFFSRTVQLIFFIYVYYSMRQTYHFAVEGKKKRTKHSRCCYTATSRQYYPRGGFLPQVRCCLLITNKICSYVIWDKQGCCLSKATCLHATTSILGILDINIVSTTARFFTLYLFSKHYYF
jgi:hypothetical protein